MSRAVFVATFADLTPSVCNAYPMKTTITLLLLLICSLAAIAQPKKILPSKTAPRRPATAAASPAPGKIDGIGKFKIGKTTLAVIAELESELNTQVKQAKTQDDVYQESGHYNVILELIPDTVSEYDGPSAASQCLAVKSYLIPRYKLADIGLEDVKLIFVGGVLADFQCSEPNELVEALEIKYGKTPVKATEETIYCTLNLTGQRISHKETMYTQSWGSATIPASYVLSVYYDSDCKKQRLSFFHVYSLPVMSKVYKCEDASRKRREASANAERKKKLSDL